MDGGTRKIRAISATWNRLVSRNWASFGFTLIGLKSIPASNRATLAELPAPLWSFSQLLRRLPNASSDSLPGTLRMPDGVPLLPNQLAPYCSAAMPNPIVSRAKPMGEYPTKPNGPSARMCNTWSDVHAPWNWPVVNSYATRPDVVIFTSTFLGSTGVRAVTSPRPFRVM